MGDKSLLEEDVKNFCSLNDSFMNSRLGTALLWFIVVFIVMIVALYITKPNVVMKKGSDGMLKDEVDFVKIFIYSTIVGLVIGIIGFLLKNRCSQ